MPSISTSPESSGRSGCDLGAHRFAELVGQNESRLVLTVEIPAELECAMTFSAVDEDRDGQEVIPDRPLPIREDGPGSRRKLLPASAAFPGFAGRERIDLTHPHSGP